MNLTYIIGDPVDAVPDVIHSNKRDDWRWCYQAAEQAQGRWVPVEMYERKRAMNLAVVAKKQGYEAEVRGTRCYLRSSAMGRKRALQGRG